MYFDVNYVICNVLGNLLRKYEWISESCSLVADSELLSECIQKAHVPIETGLTQS